MLCTSKKYFKVTKLGWHTKNLINEEFFKKNIINFTIFNIKILKSYLFVWFFLQGLPWKHYLWRNPIFMNLFQYIIFSSWNMSLDSYNIFIEFIFVSHTSRLMKKVYRIHFYESSWNMCVDSWKNTHKTFIELTPGSYNEAIAALRSAKKHRARITRGPWNKDFG